MQYGIPQQITPKKCQVIEPGIFKSIGEGLTFRPLVWNLIALTSEFVNLMIIQYEI